MKTCTRCRRELPLTAFHHWSRSKDGRNCWCKECRSDYSKTRSYCPVAGRHNHLWSQYRLRPEAYDALLRAQDGRCASCGDAFSEAEPNVDHDHESGVVRGLLCRYCNVALGNLRDSPKRVEALLNYIERTSHAQGVSG